MLLHIYSVKNGVSLIPFCVKTVTITFTFHKSKLDFTLITSTDNAQCHYPVSKGESK